MDSTGAAYITGYTYSSDFPVANAYQGTFGGARDAFISKFSADGSNLQYSTYLGGTSEDRSQSLALDSTGAAYVTGYTYSSDFPVAFAYQGTFGDGIDAFVSRLSANGSSLEYSTYLGGSGDDQGNSIALDSGGAAYVAGYAESSDFPVADAYQGTNGGGRDTFVARIFLGCTLTVETTGSGTGTVSSSPDGIDCGNDCSEVYEEGESVTLSAMPGSDSYFTGWSGACSGTGSCTVGMDDDQTITATFSATNGTTVHSLTVNTDGTGTGTVTSNPAGIDCGDHCLADFPENTQMRLTASPDAGFALAGWTFDYPDTASCPGNGICFFSMDQDYSVRATFTADSDGDGVMDVVENQGPNAGDANQDGESDYLQADVATFQDIHGNWVTLIAEENTWFRQVAAMDNPYSDELPTWVVFPGGLYQFEVENLSSGASTVVKMLLFSNYSVVAYLKWGPTPDNSSAHWYSFDYDGTLGAEITHENGLTVILLHLQDGEFGDDGLIADSKISNLGGAYSASYMGGGSGGGCSCSSPVFASRGANVSANFDISFLIIMILGLVVVVIRRRFP